MDHQAISQYLAAFATTLAAVVALFGPKAQAKWFQPKLELSLDNGTGVATPINLTDPDGNSRTANARFYHVRLVNKTPWPAATQTQVCLLQVHSLRPNGEYGVDWTGEIPMIWTYREAFPLFRTVGREARADLCGVTEGKWLSIETLIGPLNLKRLYRVEEGKPVHIQLTLQARSVQAESNKLKVKVSWDLAWADGDSEMARHLVVETV